MLDEGWGNVVMWFGAGDDPGDLQSINKYVGESREKSVTLIDAFSDKWVDRDFGPGLGQWWVESRDVIKVEECIN